MGHHYMTGQCGSGETHGFLLFAGCVSEYQGCQTLALTWREGGR